MAKLKKNVESLCLPVFVIMVSDMALTLIGQPQRYWQHFLSPNETNPFGIKLLELHPLAFISAFLIYLWVMCVFITHLKPLSRLILFLHLCIYHGDATIGWIVGFLPLFFSKIYGSGFDFNTEIGVIDVSLRSLTLIWMAIAIEKSLKKKK